MVHNVSNNPNYRPSDPPQVGSQQFNNNYGSQPQPGQGQPGQYGSGAGQYGSGAGQYSQGQPYGQQNLVCWYIGIYLKHKLVSSYCQSLL